MSFSQKSDVKKHPGHLFKKTHYLTPEDQTISAENGHEISAGTGGAVLLDDRKPILVVSGK